MLRRAQRFHPGIGDPRALAPGIGLVDRRNVGDAGALQGKGSGEAGHAGADHDDIAQRLTARTITRLDPVRPGKAQNFEIPGEPRLQRGEAIAGRHHGFEAANYFLAAKMPAVE